VRAPLAGYIKSQKIARPGGGDVTREADVIGR
jgi:hypothetical protein